MERYCDRQLRSTELIAWDQFYETSGILVMIMVMPIMMGGEGETGESVAWSSKVDCLA